jgi:hypothetical protein
VINQASGMLMMVYDTDAEAAFAVLKKRSQDTNTKLRALAAQLLSDVRKLDYRAQPPTHASLDHLLLTAHERLSENTWHAAQRRSTRPGFTVFRGGSRMSASPQRSGGQSSDHGQPFS